MNKELSRCQEIVLNTLYDVSQHEGGAIILKNRYHSAAMALVRRGWVAKYDCGFYRPRYEITPEGAAMWIERNLTRLMTTDQHNPASDLEKRLPEPSLAQQTPLPVPNAAGEWRVRWSNGEFEVVDVFAGPDGEWLWHNPRRDQHSYPVRDGWFAKWWLL